MAERRRLEIEQHQRDEAQRRRLEEEQRLIEKAERAAEVARQQEEQQSLYRDAARYRALRAAGVVTDEQADELLVPREVVAP